MKSAMSSIGSPKNVSPPCSSICSRPRWIAPTLAALTLPYSVVNCAGVVADVLQHRAQVLQVEQQQAVVVGDLEHQLQHAGLGLVEVEHARQQQRAHVGDRGAHRVALLAEHVPQRGRAGARLGRGRCRAPSAPRPASSPSVPAWLMPVRSPLTSAMNTGTPMPAEVLGQGLQGDGLAGAGGAGDQAVAVGQRRQQVALDVAVSWRPGSVRPWQCSEREWQVESLRADPKIAVQPDRQPQTATHPWPDIPNGPTSSTARAARTRSAARSGPA